MPERDGYIPGVPCWVDTTQPDPEAAVAFYSRLFGWDVEDVMPPGSEAKYLIARIRGGDVAGAGSIPPGAPPRAVWNTYIWVENADDTAARVRDAGGTALMEPGDVMEAGRTAVFADPEGAVFCVWQAKQHKGSRVVNEHGSVNFNGLNTRNPDAAKAFYGSVFGWQTLTLPSGDELWTLPGYGDHLERDNPGLRKMIADVGGPPGFEDVVAALKPIPEGQADPPAHWDVTFAVNDADAAARKATELGAKVLAGPFDAPWARTTVIEDPQGATFITNQFVAENKDVASPARASAGAS
jgi:uncharacterized protein